VDDNITVGWFGARLVLMLSVLTHWRRVEQETGNHRQSEAVINTISDPATSVDPEQRHDCEPLLQVYGSFCLCAKFCRKTGTLSCRYSERL